MMGRRAWGTLVRRISSNLGQLDVVNAFWFLTRDFPPSSVSRPPRGGIARLRPRLKTKTQDFKLKISRFQDSKLQD
jgi:hypothetical protein